MPALQYILLGFIFSVLIFVVYCLFMKVILKPADLVNVANVNTEMFEREPLPPMSALQKANFFGMLSFVFLMLLLSVLQNLTLTGDFIVIRGLNILTGWLETLGATGIAIFITAVLCVIRIKGKPVLDFPAVAANGVNWDIFVMVAAAMAIATALTNEATGVLDTMIVVFRPFLGGHSPLMFFVVMLLVGIFVTSFASSMVIGIALMPVLVAFGVSAGANLAAVAATTTLLLHYSIILPSASVFAAMLWSNEEWITRKEVFKYGAFIVVAATVAAITIIMPISLALF